MKSIAGVVLMVLALFVNLSAQKPQRALPVDVHVVAEKSEDVIDFYLNKDWEKARTLVDSLSQRAATIQKLQQENGMSTSSVDLFGYFVFRLQALTREKTQPILAALNANQITALLIDLQKYYVHTTPLQIAWLDYLGREVVLLAQLPGDYGLLSERIKQLQQTWNEVQPTIKQRKGEKVAMKMNQLVYDLEKSTSRSQMIKNGNQVLDLVDRLEALF